MLWAWVGLLACAWGQDRVWRSEPQTFEVDFTVSVPEDWRSLPLVMYSMGLGFNGVAPKLTNEAEIHVHMQARSYATWPVAEAPLGAVQLVVEPVPGSLSVSMDTTSSVSVQVSGTDNHYQPMSFTFATDPFVFSAHTASIEPFLLPAQEPPLVVITPDLPGSTYDFPFAVVDAPPGSTFTLPADFFIHLEPESFAVVTASRLRTEVTASNGEAWHFETNGADSQPDGRFRGLVPLDAPGDSLQVSYVWEGDVSTSFHNRASVDIRFEATIPGSGYGRYEFKLGEDPHDSSIDTTWPITAPAVYAGSSGQPQSSAQIAFSKLWLERTDENDGFTPIGETSDYRWAISNQGAADLIVYASLEGDPEFSLEADQLTVAAGDTGPAVVAFLPRATRPHPARPYQATLKLETNDPFVPVIEIPLRGEGLASSDLGDNGGATGDRSDSRGCGCTQSPAQGGSFAVLGWASLASLVWRRRSRARV